MVKAIDIANFFIDTAKDDDTLHGVSKLGVNKLLYFAQLAYIKRYGKPLFNEKFEVWKYGPVSPEVERRLNKEGYVGEGNTRKISSTIGTYDYYNIPEDAVEVLMDVYMQYAYGSTAGELVNASHVDGSPWEKLYVSGKRHTVIPESELVEYAKETSILPSSGMNHFRGHVDEKLSVNGNPVISRDFSADPDYCM